MWKCTLGEYEGSKRPAQQFRKNTGLYEKQVFWSDCMTLFADLDFNRSRMPRVDILSWRSSYLLFVNAKKVLDLTTAPDCHCVVTLYILPLSNTGDLRYHSY